MSLDIYIEGTDGELLYEANITHNLNAMADAAGIYGVLWRPEENGVTVAGDMADRLAAGIAQMSGNADEFRVHNADNQWGTYEQFLPWLCNLLAACRRYPRGVVRVRR